ncbi:hypothetical protein G3570_06665 [Balneolaceae bacterium YR4-1]|uniref:Uncharacterized protein n=1 Tax=Halalkalibaculum roseum TaxID=2709311 RepID=A0A6M1T0M4_9BACT|nr:hypothetical protein [Halalkalibaculum roseum]NGP76307.1 hypothetical protein [Halalkalibaculum roseum]
MSPSTNTNEKVKALYDKVLNEELEPVELGSALYEITNAGKSISFGYRGVLDVVFLKENLKTNRKVKSMTKYIFWWTITNVIFVAIPTYFVNSILSPDPYPGHSRNIT